MWPNEVIQHCLDIGNIHPFIQKVFIINYTSIKITLPKKAIEKNLLGISVYQALLEAIWILQLKRKREINPFLLGVYISVEQKAINM